MDNIIKRYPAIPFVAPFAAFLILLGLRSYLPIASRWEYPLRVVIVSGVLVLVSRGIISWRPVRPASSVFIGVLVFAIWILPDLVWPSYRHHWLFENAITGTARSSLPAGLRSDAVFLAFRLFGTMIVVPIIEELFWRGWLPRYMIDSNFRKIPLGNFSAMSFCLTAALFASEHGPFWDVGLLAGLTYNWWMLRTRNLADCMIAHAVTNACLGAFVVFRDQWQYWL